MGEIEDTGRLGALFSWTMLFFTIVAFYVSRALWIARREWAECAADTKILYLLVAPVLTLAVDVLSVTDKLFWSRGGAKQKSPSRSRPKAFNRFTPRENAS